MQLDAKALALPAPVLARVTKVGEVLGLPFADLSEFFNPFLGHFVQEALAGGGEVWTATVDGDLEGMLIYNCIERVGSIFSRDPRVAEALFDLKDHVGIFSEFALSARTEGYLVLGTNLNRDPVQHRFSHPVRIARDLDRPEVVRMLKEVYGPIDTSWVEAFSPDKEACLVVNVGPEIAGVGWVSVVKGHGRLHSLSVRPRYPRIAVGTDLWHARVLWARQAGARDVISEISEQNVASLAIARQGGMEPIGRLLLSYGSRRHPNPGSG